MYVGESLAVNILIATGTVLGMLYFYLTSTHDYWKKRGVPYLKPSLLFGNVKDLILMRKTISIMLQDIYKELKGNRFGGYFEMRTPVLMILDPELVERIFIKDFSYFPNRDLGHGFNLDTDPLLGNVALLTTEQSWKNVRNKLTPLYTTNKLKSVMGQIIDSSNGLLEDIDKCSDTIKAVDAKDLVASFAMDLSGSISCGVQYRPQSPEGVEFRRIVNSIVPPPFLQRIRGLLIIFCSKLSKLLKISFFPREVTDYYINLIKTSMDIRKRNNFQRNDFLQLFMNLRDEEQSGEQNNWKSEVCEEDAYLNQMDYSTNDSRVVWTAECIAAQMFMFVVGSSEVLATAVQFSLFELAANPDVQARLQQEVDSILAQHDGKITYESLKQMHYLDLFVQERNRKYGGFIQRICAAPYLIPGTDVIVEKGTKVFISLHGIHHDPEYYPEPEKFIPERFEGNNYRSSGIYFPFGDGPRMCIAMRFVILMLKACIAKIALGYSVSLDPKTKVPIEFDPKTPFTFKPKGGIWISFKRRKTA